MAQKVTFKGQLMQVQSRITASGDKGGKAVIEFNLYEKNAGLVGKLDRLVKTDEEVKVTIEE